MRTSLVLRSSLFLVTSALLGGFGNALQGDTFSAHMAKVAGSNLSRAECEARMQELSSLLTRAGYGPVRMVTFSDGTVVARWFHTGSQRSALVFTGLKASGNVFGGSEDAGVVRLNEFLGER